MRVRSWPEGRPIRLVGLTGGIASGKSTAARVFEALGARVIDADRVARRVVEPGRPALAEIRQAFGPGVIRPDGSLDREALGRIVFSDGGARKRLNAIVHPRVAEEVERELAEALRADPRAVVVYDVPLLFEGRMEDRFDLVVVVHVHRELQERRLRARDGLGPEEALARIRSQMDIDEKARRAHVVLDNRGEPADLEEQVRRLMERIRRHNARFGVDKRGPAD